MKRGFVPVVTYVIAALNMSFPHQPLFIYVNVNDEGDLDDRDDEVSCSSCLD